MNHLSTPHATLTTLIPFLFSPDDSLILPRALISKPTLQAIHYLSLEPSDDKYWNCGTKDSQLSLARRELIESGLLESIELGKVQYSCDGDGDSENELKSLIPISLPSTTTTTTNDSSNNNVHNPILDVILIHEQAEEKEEEEGGGGAGWKFLRLSSPSILINSPNNGFNALVSSSKSKITSSSKLNPQDWFDTIEQAQSQSQSQQRRGQFRTKPDELNLSFYRQQEEEEKEEEERDEYDEYGTLRSRKNETSTRGGTNRVIKTREEMAEGEGTTPGAYGDSNDFWAGWSDSDGEGEGEGDERDSGIGFVNDTRGKDTEKEEQEDENYWNGYGKVENQVDDGRQQQQPPQEGGDLTDPTTTKLHKTRSRRSSTVTPFNLSTLSPPVPPPSSSLSSMTAPPLLPQTNNGTPSDSQVQPSTTANPPPPLATALNLAAATQPSTITNNDNDNDDVASELATRNDENLRFVLTGIWGMYNQCTDGVSREERVKRFERVVSEVLRS